MSSFPDNDTGLGPGTYNYVNISPPYTDNYDVPGPQDANNLYRIDLTRYTQEGSSLSDYPLTPNPDQTLVGFNPFMSVMGDLNQYYRVDINGTAYNTDGGQPPIIAIDNNNVVYQTRGRNESIYQTVAAQFSGLYIDYSGESSILTPPVSPTLLYDTRDLLSAGSNPDKDVTTSLLSKTSEWFFITLDAGKVIGSKLSTVLDIKKDENGSFEVDDDNSGHGGLLLDLTPNFGFVSANNTVVDIEASSNLTVYVGYKPDNFDQVASLATIRNGDSLDPSDLVVNISVGTDQKVIVSGVVFSTTITSATLLDPGSFYKIILEINKTNSTANLRIHEAGGSSTDTPISNLTGSHPLTNLSYQIGIDYKTDDTIQNGAAGEITTVVFFNDVLSEDEKTYLINYGYSYHEPLYINVVSSARPEAPGEYSYSKIKNNPIADFSLIHWSALAEGLIVNDLGEDKYYAEYYDTNFVNYLPLNLYDRYFREVGNNQVAYVDGSETGTPFLGLVNMSYEITFINYDDVPSDISPDGYEAVMLECSSDCHHAMQNIFTTTRISTDIINRNSVVDPSVQVLFDEIFINQLILLRWLQSPEGPFAGGVTNSHNGRYDAVTDGRENAKFFGMTYTYAPGKVNPPSNNSVEWQTLGHMGTADLFLQFAKDELPLTSILEAILDHYVEWFLDHITFPSNTSIVLPTLLSWTSDTQIVGQTASMPNTEGKYEYLPTLAIEASDLAALSDASNTFWTSPTVPNPNLHCSITQSGTDLGIATTLSYILTIYARAKTLLGHNTTPIAGSNYTAADASSTSKKILDIIWSYYRDETGIFETRVCTEYNKMNSSLQIPEGFTGWSIYGDDIDHTSTFIDARSFLKRDPKWPEVEDYINDTGPAPTFTYHRTWIQCMYAIACGAYHRYTVVEPAQDA